VTGRIDLCNACGTEAPIAARGMCSPCYQRALHHDEFEDLQAHGKALASVVPAFVPTPWAEDALCSETDPEIFVPEKGGSTREGKAVCAECVVRAECLGYALDTGQRFGIWGGLSERERRRLLGMDDESEEASAA